MQITTKEIQNNAIFLMPNNEKAIIEISYKKNKKGYYFIRYLDADDYHYSTYCSPLINDIVNEINLYFLNVKP